MIPVSAGSVPKWQDKERKRGKGRKRKKERSEKDISREVSMTEMELKSPLLKKKRDGKQLERSELNKLCREI